jgi:hypothetical protein
MQRKSGMFYKAQQSFGGDHVRFTQRPLSLNEGRGNAYPVADG